MLQLAPMSAIGKADNQNFMSRRPLMTQRNRTRLIIILHLYRFEARLRKIGVAARDITYLSSAIAAVAARGSSDRDHCLRCSRQCTKIAVVAACVPPFLIVAFVIEGNLAGRSQQWRDCNQQWRGPIPLRL